MKHQILSILMLAAAMATVACSSDDKAAATASAQNCLNTGCSLQKVALAQVPGSPESAALAARGILPSPTANPIPPIPPGVPTTNPAINPVTGIAVSSKQIQAQAAKVAAALEADSSNPMSSHYVAPQDGSAGRAPASAEPAAIAQTSGAGQAAPAMETGGEAAK